MTRFMAVKTPGGQLQPLPEYRDSLERLGNGEMVTVNITKPRNIKLHRKFFALIRALWDMENVSEEFDSEEGVRAWITVAAGHYTSMQLNSGIEVRIPKTINFAEMDDTEFREFYDKAVNAALQRFLPNFTPEHLDQYVEDICRF